MSLNTVMVRCAAVGLTALVLLVGASTAGASASVRPTPASAAGGRHHPDPLRPFGRLNHDVVSSSNWSGYAVESTGKFTDVRASWIQPGVICGRRSSYSSFWAGLDGYSSDSVEQIGSDSDCAGGAPVYYAWYELYPAGSVELSATRYPVRAGNRLSAEVAASGSTFTLTLKSSAGWTYTTTRTVSGLARSSAEIIAESPEICGYFCRVAPLSDFGSVSFTGAVAAVNGGADRPLGSFTFDNGPHEIVAVTGGGQVKAQPTALSASGSAFGVSWRHS